jgi:hypothetical protein
MLNFNPEEVAISDKELSAGGDAGIDVQLIALEEVEHDDLPYDQRLSHLSAQTRSVITQLFGGDVTMAEVNAHQICNVYRNPPAWALEIHGAHRAGWKSFDRERT